MIFSIILIYHYSVFSVSLCVSSYYFVTQRDTEVPQRFTEEEKY